MRRSRAGREYTKEDSAAPSKNAVSANIKHSSSIKHQISGLSTTVVKGCMYMFDMVDNTFSY